MPYANLFFELTNKCNASCPWCPAGEQSKYQLRDYVKPEDFAGTMNDLLSREFIDKDTIVHLFNFSEPFLHPDIDAIIAILNTLDIGYSLSTNGSIPPRLKGTTSLKNLRSVIISMSGFSQQSYNKIHGLNFNKVTDNVKKLLDKLRRQRFQGYTQLAYHVYQFNMHEIKQAEQFAQLLKADFNPYYAFMGDLELFLHYRKGTLEYEKLALAARQLMLHFVSGEDVLVNDLSTCPQYDMLALDWDCSLMLCCAVTRDMKDARLGKITNYTKDEVERFKCSAKICQDCIKLGISDTFHNPVPYIRE